ncbi:hypothetical protein SARC_14741 [Sphaeroforma arctica JP610]|uniref:Uncharacterized protein n=1 Tax=Sphaeroforma arctica JP610 TaxID=667725 RepID=A0A0L0F7K6_9EUKA|nr:hypothetical protein SARC_14741 [Sphaeroforma arctica JP610]KNC72700.1 hypothetical protein SARC_14741 [Sphaeroforma arctica JP610]|eukprot:XP_014146602.1 hypothetical protein SARC_14741 [Sphaeroforma arctica JP610]
MVDMTEVQTWLFTIRKWYHVYIFCTGLIIFTLLGLRMEMGVFYALLSTNNSNHDPGTDYTTVLLNISIMIILAVLSAFCVLANALLIQEEYRGLGFMVMRL